MAEDSKEGRRAPPASPHLSIPGSLIEGASQGPQINKHYYKQSKVLSIHTLRMQYPIETKIYVVQWMELWCQTWYLAINFEFLFTISIQSHKEYQAGHCFDEESNSQDYD